MPTICFNYADIKPFSLNGKKVLKKFVTEIFTNEGQLLNRLDYVFCTDTYLLEINKEFLQHDFFTDIISFDLSKGEVIRGELYISIDRIKENAITNACTFKNELLRVMFHGALHLCGYNDKKKSEITIMKRKEDYYLQLYAKLN